MDAVAAHHPGEHPSPEQPHPTPSAAERLANLDREIARLRREMHRLLRLMALLEHDLAVERIVALQPGLLHTLVARLKRWTSWLRA